jgi:hypothetical protein
MITDAGTKEPRSEADLAILTGFEPWQIRATLADLSEPGLVRRLEGAVPIWEIAHDFLARTIGQLIGRLKPSTVERVRPLVAPVVLLGWIALFVLAVPYWLTLQQNALVAILQEKGGSFTRAKPEGISLSFTGLLDDDELIKTWGALEKLHGLKALKFVDYTDITSLQPLEKLTNLSQLTLINAFNITSLEPLKRLTNLNQLTLEDTAGSLEPLKGLTNLNQLTLKYTDGIANLEPLKGLTNLTQLSLQGSGITSLEPLKGLTNLHSLLLVNIPGITSLEPLKGLTHLNHLYLRDSHGITSLEPLKGMKLWIDGASDELRATMK